MVKAYQDGKHGSKEVAKLEAQVNLGSIDQGNSIVVDQDTVQGVTVKGKVASGDITLTASNTAAVIGNEQCNDAVLVQANLEGGRQINLGSISQKNSIDVSQDTVQTVQLKGKVTVGDISLTGTNTAVVAGNEQCNDALLFQANDQGGGQVNGGQVNLGSIDQNNSIDVNQGTVQIVQLKGKITIGDVTVTGKNTAVITENGQGNDAVLVQANVQGGGGENGGWKKLAKLDAQVHFGAIDQQNSIDVDQNIVQVVQLKGRVTVGDLNLSGTNTAVVADNLQGNDAVLVQANLDACEGQPVYDVGC